ncbi:MAG: radical SAM protein [Promethearchaeota archaeon]
MPFCQQLCAFCPFHKVLYRVDLKDAYLEALVKEIHRRGAEGQVEWVYIGGGTPNLLTPDEIGRIFTALRQYVDLSNIGMEGNPRQFTPEYLEGVRELGVEKISMGVESLKPGTLQRVNREKVGEAHIRTIIEYATDLDQTVNVNLMVGLPGQSPADFLSDVKRLGTLGPQQITTYPFMAIPGVKVDPAMSSHEMFSVIEDAGDILASQGYNRENVWVFSKSKKIYDSARDELVIDYVGFGAAAFSKVLERQIVNPPLALYLDMLHKDHSLAFQTTVDEQSEYWRRFAHELYNLQLNSTVIKEMPRSIKFVLGLLRLAGHVRNGRVTEKGRFFVHDLTKTVVESLPFPVSNPSAITNLEDFERAQSAARHWLSPKAEVTVRHPKRRRS